MMLDLIPRSDDPGEQAVLDKVAEDDYIRFLGSRGRFEEIARPLGALVGELRDRALVVPPELRGDYRPSTPSIHFDPASGRRRAIMRGVNYRQAADGSTLFDRGVAKCVSRNWWVSFDADWRPVDWRVMRDSPARPGAVQGFEDCRLFRAAGSYWASFNFAERPSLFAGEGVFALLCEMGVLKLDDEGGIEDVFALRGPWSLHHQKNWKPAPTDAEPLRWIYASDPLTLVTPAMATARRSIHWLATSAWRGSTQALQLPGGQWLWVDHRAVIRFDEGRNLYLHRFTLADRDLTRVEAVSEPWVFRSYGVEFCAGLAIDGERLVLSYSVKDALPFITSCGLEAALATLRPVR